MTSEKAERTTLGLLQGWLDVEAMNILSLLFFIWAGRSILGFCLLTFTFISLISSGSGRTQQLFQPCKQALPVMCNQTLIVQFNLRRFTWRITEAVVAGSCISIKHLCMHSHARQIFPDETLRSLPKQLLPAVVFQLNICACTATPDKFSLMKLCGRYRSGCCRQLYFN